MSAELVAILAVGVAAAGIVFNGQRNMEKRLDSMEGSLRAVEHGLAKLEGLLEGLREALAGRRDAA